MGNIGFYSGIGLDRSINVSDFMILIRNNALDSFETLFRVARIGWLIHALALSKFFIRFNRLQRMLGI